MLMSKHSSCTCLFTSAIIDFWAEADRWHRSSFAVLMQGGKYRPWLIACDTKTQNVLAHQYHSVDEITQKWIQRLGTHLHILPELFVCLSHWQWLAGFAGPLNKRAVQLPLSLSCHLVENHVWVYVGKTGSNPNRNLNNPYLNTSWWDVLFILKATAKNKHFVTWKTRMDYAY